MMKHKVGKNKRCSFSAATNLKDAAFGEKNAATKLNTQLFCNSKKKMQLFGSCLIKNAGFTQVYKNLQLFCTFLKNTQKSFLQSCVLFSQGMNQLC